jgi:hypothetical protein
MATPADWAELQGQLLRSPLTAGILEILDRQGGWRGLFDPFAEEWNWCSLRTKSQLLKGFEAAGYPKGLLLRLLKQSYVQRGRPDLAASCDEAIRRLAPHLMHRRNGHWFPRCRTQRISRTFRWTERPYRGSVQGRLLRLDRRR